MTTAPEITQEAARKMLEALKAQEELSRVGIIFASKQLLDDVPRLRKAAIDLAEGRAP